jgi:hypothetical protein
MWSWRYDWRTRGCARSYRTGIVARVRIDTVSVHRISITVASEFGYGLRLADLQVGAVCIHGRIPDSKFVGGDTVGTFDLGARVAGYDYIPRIACVGSSGFCGRRSGSGGVGCGGYGLIPILGWKDAVIDIGSQVAASCVNAWVYCLEKL